jgi:hypothetical protein
LVDDGPAGRVGWSHALSGHLTVFIFNFLGLLADPSTNMLRADYQADEWDAHPNELANRTIGPLFADFIDQAVRTYTARW